VRHAAWHLEKSGSKTWISMHKMGVEKAIELALGYVWETLRDVRAGRFSPQPPDEGCPSYCPAAAFCWHYEERGW
jgi:hypothetical protein